jgi:hypothetical protein
VIGYTSLVRLDVQMPTYKFIYFNGRARGEVIRVLFAVAGVKYEDKRVEQADWPALKPGKYCICYVYICVFI